MKKTILSLVMLSVLGACGPSPQDSVMNSLPQQPQPMQQAAPAQPVIVNAAPVASNHDGMLTGGLLGAAAGYMLGKGGNNAPAAPAYEPARTRVIERQTTIIKHVPAPAATPAPVATPAAPAPARSKDYGSVYAATKPAAAPAPSRSSSYGSVSRSSSRR